MLHELGQSGMIFLWTVLIIYMLAMLAIGYFCGKRVDSLDDYVVAGRRLPLYMAVATMVATQFGAGSCMGVAAQVYSTNVRDVIQDPISMSVCLLLAGWFIVGKLRQARCTTVPDILDMKYGKATGIFAGIAMLPVYIGWTGSQMIGFGTILHLITGINASWGIIIGGLVVIVYTLYGGMWAVTLTDVVQVLILILGLVLVIPGIFMEFGGISEGFNEIFVKQKELVDILPEKNIGFGGHVNYVGQWIIMGLGCMVGQELIQRSMASRNVAIAKQSSIISGYIYFLLGLIPITVGLAAKILVSKWGVDVNAENLENEILPRAAAHYLNPVLLTFFLCGLVAAIMSSADSALLATGTLLVKNVILPLKPDIPLKKQLLLTRITVFLALIISIVMALTVDSIYQLMVNSWASLLVVVVMPCIAALYLKKSGWISVLSCMISGTAVWLGYTIYQGHKIPGTIVELLNDDDFLFHLTNGSVYGFVTGIVVFFLVYFLWDIKHNPAIDVCTDKEAEKDNQPEDIPVSPYL